MGDVIPVPAEQLQSVRLETDGGTLITTARLGQTGGKRAVRPSGQENPLQVRPGADTQAFEKTLDPTATGEVAAVAQLEPGLPVSVAVEPESAAEGIVPLEAIPKLPDPETTDK